MKDSLQFPDSSDGLLTAARARWLEASARASALAAELFQPGSGYGDPEARMQDQHKLESARLDAERLFREYNDLERRTLESKMVTLQRSQRLATWASFAVAAVVGAATIVKTCPSARRPSVDASAAQANRAASPGWANGTSDLNLTPA